MLVEGVIALIVVSLAVLFSMNEINVDPPATKGNPKRIFEVKLVARKNNDNLETMIYQLEAMEEDNITFSCNYEPKSIVVRQHSIFSFIDLDRRKILQKGKMNDMVLEDIDPKLHSGRYRCDVDGPEGRMSSNNFILRIEMYDAESGGPFAQLRGRRLSLTLNGTEEDPDDIVEGVSIIFACNYYPPEPSLPDASYYILHNDTVIQLNDKNHFVMKKITKTVADGRYRCRLNSTIGRLQSKTMKLDVKRKPEIYPINVIPSVKIRVDKENIEEFDHVTLNCDFESNDDGMTALGFKWFHKGRRLFEGGAADIKLDGSTLELPSIRKSFEGFLVCEVQTEEGRYFYSDSKPLYIYAEKIYDVSKSRIPLQLKLGLGNNTNPQIRLYDDIYFVYSLKPFVKDIYDLWWFHNESRLWPNETGPNIMYGSSTLILKNITKESAGTYSCRIQTDEGWLMSNSVNVDVEDEKLETTTMTVDPGLKQQKIETTTMHDYPLLIEIEEVGGGGRHEQQKVDPGLKKDAVVLSSIRIRNSTNQIYYFKKSDDVELSCVIPKEQIASDIRGLLWTRNDQKLVENDKVVMLGTRPVETLILLNVDENYNGIYRCQIITSHFTYQPTGDSVTLEIGRLTTNALPTVYASLGSGIVPENIAGFSVLHFRCNVTPITPNIRYLTWWHNETNHCKTCDGRFDCIIDVEKNSSGQYHCVVGTDRGYTVESNPVRVTVKVAPANSANAKLDPFVYTLLYFEKDTGTLLVYEGDTIYILCVIVPREKIVKGRPVYWFYGNQQIFDRKGKYILKDQDYCLHIQHASKNDFGIYSCAVEIDGKNYTSVSPAQFSSILSVDVKPVRLTAVKAELLNDPNNVGECDSLYFFCNLEPSSYILKDKIFWYRWIGKVFNITNQGPRTDFHDRSMKFELVGPEDTGLYWCGIDNPTIFNDASIHKVYARLDTVHERRKNSRCDLDGKPNTYPVLNPTQVDKIYETDDVRFFCDTQPRSLEMIDILWRRHHPINPSETVLYDQQTLILLNVGKEDAGGYTCRMKTKYGLLSGDYEEIYVQDKRTAHLNLGRNSTLTNISKSDGIYFTCSAAPNTTIVHNIRWFFNGKELVESENDIAITLRRTSLIIPCIKRTHTGNFACVVEFDQGYKALSNTLAINVKDAPGKTCNKDLSIKKPIVIAELLHHPSYIYENQTISFYCYVYPVNYSFNSISWRHNGEEIMKTTASHERTIEIRDVQTTSEGNYTCVITDYEGHDFYSEPAKLLNIRTLRETPEKHHLQNERMYGPPEDKILVHHHKNERISGPAVYAILLDPHGPYYVKDAVFFYCKISDNIEIKFDKVAWFYDNQMISENHMNNRYTIYGRTLKINEISSRATHKYSCQIDTINGTSKSDPAALPEIEQKNPGEEQYTGPYMKTYQLVENNYPFMTKRIVMTNETKNIALMCSPVTKEHAYPSFKFYWLRNNQKLPGNGTKHGLTYGDKKQSIHFPDDDEMRKNLKGSYRCKANSKYGPVESTNSIYLGDDPMYEGTVDSSLLIRENLTEIPIHVTEIEDTRYFYDVNCLTVPKLVAELLDAHEIYYEDDAVFFYCKIEPLNIIYDSVAWYYYSLMETSDRSEFQIFLNGRTLMVGRLSNSTAGLYYCKIETKDGTYQSDPTPLPRYIKEDPNRENRNRDPRLSTQVLDPETFKPIPSLTEIVVSKDWKNLALICRPENRNTGYINFVKIFWFKNGQRLPSHGKEYGFEYGHRNQTIHFHDDPEERKLLEGRYSCEADTFYGYLKSVQSVDLVIRVDSTYKERASIVDFDENIVASVPNSKYEFNEKGSSSRIPTARIELLDSDKDYYENDAAFLYCDIKPADAVYEKIDWIYYTRKTDKNTHVDTKLYTISADGRTLKIKSISSATAGNYSCRIYIEQSFTTESSIMPQPKYLVDDDPDRIKFDGPVLETIQLHPETKERFAINAMVETNKYPKINLMCFPKYIKYRQSDFIEISWRKNNEPLPANGIEYGFEYGFNNQTLYFSNDPEKRKNFNGTYHCEAKTKYGYLISRNSVYYKIDKSQFYNPTNDEFKASQIPINMALNQLARVETDTPKDNDAHSNTVIPKVYAELLDPLETYYEDDIVYYYCCVEPPDVKVHYIEWYHFAAKTEEEYRNDSVQYSADYRTMRFKLSPLTVGLYYCAIETNTRRFESNFMRPPAYLKKKWDYINRDGPVLYTMEFDTESSALINRPKIVVTNSDTNVTLKCHPSKIKSGYFYFFEILWYKDYSMLPAKGTGFRFGYRNQTIHFSDDFEERKSLNGTYHCQATTAYGPLYSKNIVSLEIDQRELENRKDNTRTLILNRYIESPELKYTSKKSDSKLCVQLLDPPVDGYYENDQVLFYCAITPLNTVYHKIQWFIESETKVEKYEPRRLFTVLHQGRVLKVNGISPNTIGNYSCRIHTQNAIFDSINSTPMPKSIEGGQHRKNRRDPSIGIQQFQHDITLTEPEPTNKTIIVTKKNMKLILVCDPINMSSKYTNIFEIVWYKNASGQNLPLPRNVIESGLEYGYRNQFIRFFDDPEKKKSFEGTYRCEALTLYGLLQSTNVVRLKMEETESKRVDVSVYGDVDESQTKNPTLPFQRSNIPAPKVTAELLDAESVYWEGESVFFYCAITPTNVIYNGIRWYRKTSTLISSPSESNVFTVIGNGRTLKINDVPPQTVYENFSCEILTESGPYKSNPTPLPLHRIPGTYYENYKGPVLFTIFYDPVNNQEISQSTIVADNETKKLTLGCIVRTKDLNLPLKNFFNIFWYRNDQRLSAIAGGWYTLGDRNLTISFSNDAENSKHINGTYFCQAETKYGYIKNTNSINLSVDTDDKSTCK